MLLNFSQRSCVVTIANFHWPALLDALAQAGYAGVLADVKRGILDRFGLLGADGSDALIHPAKRTHFAEVFFPDAHSAVYLKVVRSYADATEAHEAEGDDIWSDPGAAATSVHNNYQLDIGEIVPIDAADGDRLSEFHAAVTLALGSFGVAEKGLVWTGGETGESASLPFATKPVDAPDARALDLAAIFRDGKLNTLMERFAAGAGSFTLEEYLASVPNREETEYYIDKLFDMEFLGEEIVVYSRTTGAPVIRAKDRAALKTLSDMGITSAEGRPLEEEDVRRLVTLPAASKAYVGGTWAAQTFLVSVLQKMGHAIGDIQAADHDGDLSLIYVRTGAGGLVFALSPGRFTDKNTKELWRAVGKSTEFKYFVFGAEGVDESAANSLGTLAGKTRVVALPDLANFNAAVVDAVNNERMTTLREILRDLETQLTVDVAGLIMRRCG